MLNGMIGNGTKVGYSATSPISYTTVGQLLNVDFPGLNPDEVETTVHSTEPWKRFIRGMIDVGEMTLTLLTDLDEGTSADQDELFDKQADGTTLSWIVEVPVDRDHTEFVPFTFDGWVKKYAVKTPIAGRIETEISVRFDGSYFTKGNAGASVLD